MKTTKKTKKKITSTNTKKLAKQTKEENPNRGIALPIFKVEAIVARLMGKMKPKQIAEEVQVSVSSVYSIQKKWKRGDYDGQLSDETMELIKKRIANQFFEKANLALKSMTKEKMDKMNAFQLSGIAGNMFQQGRAASQSIEDTSVIKKIVVQINNESVLEDISVKGDQKGDQGNEIIDLERNGNEYSIRNPEDDDNRPGGDTRDPD